jgi:hypothetical protein
MVFITINALHVLGGSSAHHQELKTVYTASGIAELELFCVCCAHAKQFQLTHASGKKEKKLDKHPMLFIQF